MKKKKKIERKNYQPRIFYPAKLSFRSEGEMKTIRQTKIEDIFHQYTCPARNVYRMSPERRKRQVRNFNLHKERKTIGEDIN